MGSSKKQSAPPPPAPAPLPTTASAAEGGKQMAEDIAKKRKSYQSTFLAGDTATGNTSAGGTSFLGY